MTFWPLPYELRRIKNQMRNPMAASNAMPPMTPPTIAPTLVFFPLEGDGTGVTVLLPEEPVAGVTAMNDRGEHLI